MSIRRSAAQAQKTIFCGSYNFDPSATHDQGYITYTTPYAGFHQVIRPDGDYRTQLRMGMYPLAHRRPRFGSGRDIKVTMQGAGLGLQSALSAAARRYRVCGVLVSDTAACRVSAAAGAGSAAGDLTLVQPGAISS